MAYVLLHPSPCEEDTDREQYSLPSFVNHVMCIMMIHPPHPAEKTLPLFLSYYREVKEMLFIAMRYKKVNREIRTGIERLDDAKY